MFWRKKKTVEVDLPESFEDHRSAYRIRPDQTRPIILNIAGNSYQVANISGTGCCIRSHKFTEGSVAAGTLRIPSEDIIFPVSVKVVSRQRDLCRCQFTKISPQAENAIHHYVLEVQKFLLRGKKD